MKKILIAGAGGAPSEGVIQSLLFSTKDEQIIGMGSEISDLVLSKSEEKYFIPYADQPEYKNSLLTLLKSVKPDFIHFQNDLEIFHASKFKDEIENLGVKTFMPSHDVIDTCVYKYKSYLKFKEAGIKVPKNSLIHTESDLKKAFDELADTQGYIWLRASDIGGGGKGSLPTNNYDFAKLWIDRYDGWGNFIAAEMLTADTVTWLSIWHEGELIVGQTRIRKGWTHGNRSVSGVTGVTKVGRTFSDPMVDKIAQEAIRAVSEKPHGIFGVDMTYDREGIPNPTEINISRFFTTVLFFTEAGLNMPEIYKNIALYQEFPALEKKINPLKDGLNWLRGMDTLPKLLTDEEISNQIKNL